MQVSKRFVVICGLGYFKGAGNDVQRGLKFGLVMHTLGLRQPLWFRSLALSKFLKMTSHQRKVEVLNCGLAGNDH